MRSYWADREKNSLKSNNIPSFLITKGFDSNTMKLLKFEIRVIHLESWFHSFDQIWETLLELEDRKRELVGIFWRIASKPISENFLVGGIKEMIENLKYLSRKNKARF